MAAIKRQMQAIFDFKASLVYRGSSSQGYTVRFVSKQTNKTEQKQIKRGGSFWEMIAKVDL